MYKKNKKKRSRHKIKNTHTRGIEATSHFHNGTAGVRIYVRSRRRRGNRETKLLGERARARVREKKHETIRYERKKKSRKSLGRNALKGNIVITCMRNTAIFIAETIPEPRRRSRVL